MKKINLFLMLFAASAILFSGCNKKDDEPEANTDKSPSIKITGGNGNGNPSFILGTGGNAPATLSFTVDGLKNAETGKKLDKVEVYLNANGSGSNLIASATQTLSGVQRDGFSITIGSIPTPTGPGTYVYTFRLTDNGGQIGEVSSTVTLVQATACTGKTITGTAAYANGVVTVTPSGGTAPYSYDYSMDNASFITSNTFIPMSSGTLTITISDADGCTGEITQAISGTGVSNSGSKTLGAQANATSGSFYDADNGTVYFQASYDAQKANLELVHFFGATNSASLASPNATEVNSTHGVTVTGAQNVIFRKMSTAIFDNVNIQEALTAYYNNGTNSTLTQNGNGVGSLTTGDEFIVYNGSKYFIVKVTGVTGDVNGLGTISVEVKG